MSADNAIFVRELLNNTFSVKENFASFIDDLTEDELDTEFKDGEIFHTRHEAIQRAINLEDSYYNENGYHPEYGIQELPRKNI